MKVKDYPSIDKYKELVGYLAYFRGFCRGIKENREKDSPEYNREIIEAAEELLESCEKVELRYLLGDILK